MFGGFQGPWDTNAAQRRGVFGNEPHAHVRIASDKDIDQHGACVIGKSCGRMIAWTNRMESQKMDDPRFGEHPAEGILRWSETSDLDKN